MGTEVAGRMSSFRAASGQVNAARCRVDGNMSEANISIGASIEASIADQHAHTDRLLQLCSHCASEAIVGESQPIGQLAIAIVSLHTPTLCSACSCNQSSHGYAAAVAHALCVRMEYHLDRLTVTSGCA